MRGPARAAGTEPTRAQVAECSTATAASAPRADRASHTPRVSAPPSPSTSHGPWTEPGGAVVACPAWGRRTSRPGATSGAPRMGCGAVCRRGHRRFDRVALALERIGRQRHAPPRLAMHGRPRDRGAGRPQPGRRRRAAPRDRHARRWGAASTPPRGVAPSAPRLSRANDVNAVAGPTSTKCSVGVGGPACACRPRTAPRGASARRSTTAR